MTTSATVTERTLLAAVERIRPVIEQYRDRAEQDRQLSAEVVAAMRDAGLFRAWTPKEYGGYELDLPVFMTVTEAIARIDSAAGWMFGVVAAGSLITAFLPQESARELFALARGPDTLFAGASAPVGRATVVEGGYRVSGRWPLTSGCHHGDWIVGMAVPFDGEMPRMGPAGMPDLKGTVFRREDCEIEDTWYTVGMRGTGSAHYVTRDAFVPEGRTFSLFTEQPHAEGPLYKLGVLPMFAMSVSAVLPGIARAAIDSFVQLAKEKTPTFSQSGLAVRPTVHAELARVEALVQAARAYLYEVAREMMATVEAGQAVPEELEARRRLACANVGSACVEAVDRLFVLAGTTPIYSGHPLERCLRDIHTVSQHLFLSPVWWEKTGQYYFGLGLGMP